MDTRALSVTAPPRKSIRVPAKVVLTRYSIGDQTLRRWLADPGIGFPRPLVVRRRRYFRVEDIEAWESARSKVEA